MIPLLHCKCTISLLWSSPPHPPIHLLPILSSAFQLVSHPFFCCYNSLLDLCRKLGLTASCQSLSFCHVCDWAIAKTMSAMVYSAVAVWPQKHLCHPALTQIAQVACTVIHAFLKICMCSWTCFKHPVFSLLHSVVNRILKKTEEQK